ncbi:MAG TPA: CorA family divalent cation transporter [Chthoniobacterales bacterium]|nr:CorA family divalent cation transporter [Chthoniobacterales bacterium]
MIQLLKPGGDSVQVATLEELSASTETLTEAFWIDLLKPEPAEEQFVEKLLNVDVPSSEEMEEISESSRLFEEDGVLYVSCWVLCFDSPIPINTSVTFVITKKQFISIRYSDHHAFRVFKSAASRLQKRRFRNSNEALAELLESIVGHIASNLRLVDQDLNALSIEIFAEQRSQRRGKSLGLKRVVQRLGKRSSMIANLLESSVSLSSLVSYFTRNATDGLQADVAARLKTLSRDIQSLREYDAQLTAQVNFLLDSTVGLINFEQNQTMKFLGVAALIVSLF